jgi:MFS family permease
MPRLADIHGRAWLYRVSILANSLLLMMVFFTKSIDVMMVLLAGMGFFNSGANTTGYVYFMEFVPEKY